MATRELQLGSVVDTSLGRGVLRFYGPVANKAGKFAGVELYEPNGKNNGTVNGIKYFTCKANYGVFVKASAVTVVPEEPERTPAPATRPVLTHQRTNSRSGLSRTPSVRSGQSSQNSRAGSPVKPVASSSSLLSPGSVAPSPKPRPTTSPTKRLSLTRPPPGRTSFPRSSPANDSTSPPSPTTYSPSPRNLESPTREHTRPATPPTAKRIRPPPSAFQSPPSPPPPSTSFHAISSNALNNAPARPLSPPHNEPKISSQKIQDDQELQELRAKIRVLEAKRADDARHVRELETRLSEAEAFVALRPKLQAKLTSQQTELIATKRDLADARQLSELAEGKLLDAQEQLEMAMLDKEVAEEKAEIAQTELDEITEKLAIVEVELEIYKEGGHEDGVGGGDSAKSSLAHIQLEKQNERLKEALIRLRDMSQESEHENRRRISEMEKEAVDVGELSSQYESALIKLSNAEVQIEDLKLQLDDALGAEEMLVQLTERNLMLGEKIEEMRITIEDLESLKELSDELEENHVETEKSLQEDLNLKDVQIRDQTRKVEALEENCQDLDNTIAQFRDLVLQLQTELDTLRAQTQTAQHESATAASQTAAMMSLNLKLQSSASKQQAKNIELEIKKLEARETRELLGIVQPYLPQLYVETDSDATSCYLFFLRLAYKADLINTVVAQAHGLPEALNGPVSEVLVGVCEMRGRISGLSTLCKRFAAVLRRCDVESFLNMGRIYTEIAPMEKRIDMHIDLLRRDEFREMECVSDVIKMQAQFDHLAETYFNGFEHDLGERELGYAVAFDHDLDIFSASIGLTKTSIAAILKDEDAVHDMADLDPESDLFDPLQKLLDQCKSAKVLSKKLTRRLEDLTHDSSALKLHLLPQLKTLSDLVPEIVDFGISLAQQIMPHLSDVRSSKSAFQLTKVLSMVNQTATSTVPKNMKPGMSPWDAVGESITQLAQEASSLLPLALEPDNVAKISGTAPWVTRVSQIKTALAVNVEAERKVAQLNDEMQGLVRSLKTKDQSIQESTVKIEMMERRLESVKKQADTIVELESEIAKSKKQDRAYEDAIEQLQTDLDTAELELAKYKAADNAPERLASGAQALEPDNLPMEGSLETSHLLEQIEALRGTVRFLRTENSYLKGQDLLLEIQSLPPLPENISRLPMPPLDPSGSSDSEDSDFDSDVPQTPPTLRSLATETKLLYRDVIKFSSSPRVVDLSTLNAKRAEAHNNGGKVWMPKKSTPAHQVWERKVEAERLNKRVRGLQDRASAIRAL